MIQILLSVFLSDFWLGILIFEKQKAFYKKISEELLPIAWHPKIWWNFCMSEDAKKEIEPIFTE